MLALTEAPAKVCAARRTCRKIINLFPHILTHIRDIEISRRAIERNPPGIAQTIRPDLISKRIATWDRVGVSRVDIKAQNLAEKHAGVLSIVKRIALRAAIA